jgi:hypothetical protein
LEAAKRGKERRVNAGARIALFIPRIIRPGLRSDPLYCRRRPRSFFMAERLQADTPEMEVP